MIRLRITVAALGILGLGIGGWFTLNDLGSQIIRFALWLVLPVLLHDGVLVPLVLALSWLGRRVLPEITWGPVVFGFIVTGTLTAVGVVALVRPAGRSAPPGLLDRNYWAGYGIALVIVWALTALVAIARMRSSRGTKARISQTDH